MCGLLHRLSDGPMPTWLVMPRDVQDAQRLATVGWIEASPPEARHGTEPGSAPPALRVESITPDGQAALRLADFGLWDLRVGCDAVCASCTKVHSCPTITLPEMLTPARQQARAAIAIHPARPSSMTAQDPRPAAAQAARAG